MTKTIIVWYGMVQKCTLWKEALIAKFEKERNEK